MILNPNQALNRFFHYLFGFNPRNHPVSLILVMIFSANATLKGGAMMDFFLNTAIMYMQFETFWMSAITPLETVKGGRRVVTLLGQKIKMNNTNQFRSNYLFYQKTGLGALRQSTIFWVYRCHQIVNTEINGVYKYVSFHLGVLLLVWSMSSFAIIRLVGRIKIIACLVLLGAWIASNWVMAFEVYFVAGVSRVGKVFIRHMRNSQMLGTCDQKLTKSLWNLHLKTSYPFFKIKNATYLEFLRVASDLSITLLLDMDFPELPWIGFRFSWDALL